MYSPGFLASTFKAFCDPILPDEVLAAGRSVSPKQASQPPPKVLFLHEAFQGYTRRSGSPLGGWVVKEVQLEGGGERGCAF